MFWLAYHCSTARVNSTPKIQSKPILMIDKTGNQTRLIPEVQGLVCASIKVEIRFWRIQFSNAILINFVSYRVGELGFL